MERESGYIRASVIMSLIMAVVLLAPAAAAGTAVARQAATPYTISGYVFVNGAPMDDVLVYTSYGGGDNALTGADSVGRHGHYTLNIGASDGPATVAAVYAKAPHAGNYSAMATIDHPDTAEGYDMQNLYIDTSQAQVTPALTPHKGLLDSIVSVMNNFISQLADWAANIGSQPGAGAGPGTVIARAVTFDAAEAPQAYLVLVNASNVSEEMYTAKADGHGVYNFSGVRSVYNATSGTYDRAYCLEAKAYGNTSTGISTPFAVIPGQAVNATVVIFPKPAHITLEGPARVNVNSHVTYMAYVTDALGHPVTDGYMVRFTLSGNDPAAGQLGKKGAETPSGQSMTVPTRGGYAEVDYGWASGAGVNTIYVAYRDDPTVNASAAVALS